MATATRDLGEGEGTPWRARRAPVVGSRGGPVQRWLAAHGHALFHPLVGADLLTLARLVAAGPRPTGRGAARLALAGLTALVRQPFDAIDALRPLPAAAVTGPPPVFILGHWRSGTTHLHNLLAASPAFSTLPPLAAGVPWAVRGLGPFLRRRLEECLPPDRLIDAVPVTPDAPQEEELALALMQPLSFLHAIFFPRSQGPAAFERGLFPESWTPAEAARWARRMRLVVAKLRARHPGRVPLLKNPPHAAKAGLLAALFPGARFVRIDRNPFAVFESTVAMLRTLLDAFALERADAFDVEALVLQTYPRLLDRLDRELARLPPGRVAALRCEDLGRDPLGALRRLHATLDLDGFEAWHPAFERAVAAAAGAGARAARAYDPGRAALVRERWALQLERLGYDAPP